MSAFLAGGLNKKKHCSGWKKNAVKCLYVYTQKYLCKRATPEVIPPVILLTMMPEVGVGGMEIEVEPFTNMLFHVVAL